MITLPRTNARGDTGGVASTLRVMLVSPVGEHGGAEQVLLTLARQLPHWGVTPFLACMRPGPLVGRAREQGTVTFAFAEHRYRQPLMLWKGMRWLAERVRETDADLLHTNHSAHLYGSLAARLAGVPVVWHVHDYPYRRESDFLSRRLAQLPTDHVLFTTQRVRSGYEQLQTRPHSVIYPTCIEPERLTTLPPCPDVRRRHGLPPGPLLLTVARLQERKGHRYLIDAVPAILRTQPDARFGIVGKASGPQQERYLEEMRAQCARLGVAQHVRFLGFVEDRDLVALYREAAALVHPARDEGYGLTLLEAMTLGTPVIAADADGPAEILADGRAGILVPRRNSAALAEAVLRLLADAGLAASLRAEGLRLAHSLRAEEMVRQTAALYRSLRPATAEARHAA